MRVLVTRPAAQAAAWVADLRAQGIDATALPLIEIAAAADMAPLHAAWHALAAESFVMFVSPNAAEHFFAARPPDAAWPSAARAGAPGPGTTRALQRLGLSPEQVIEPAADSPQFDSEALWQQLKSQDWAGRPVLVVRGDGGREWLADTLAAHGARVAFVAAYQRRAPRWAAAEQALAERALAHPGEYLWLFSSSESIDHLVAWRPGADWRAALALASHPRIAERARSAGFGRVQLCRPALPAVVAAVVGCIQSAAS